MIDDTSPQLTWTEDGEPRSGRFGDVYFSRDDGLAETRAVFLDGCGLPDAWAGRRRFSVAELGFGTGLNIAALLTLWRETRPEGGRLNIFSIEGFPLAADEARRALGAWPELAEAAQALTDAWPAPTPGFHRLDLPGFHAVLDLAIGDAAWALDQWSGPADAWFLDGFSPALNPAMWSDPVMDRIAALSAPDARVATFTVAGAVRRGLSERGFVVEKKPGHGRKRERLEARLNGARDPDARPKIAVIGAGIAGAAVARALVASGMTPVVLEAERPGAGGSGFPAGLATPRLDAGDPTIAGLYAQALERARDLYDATPDAVLGHGVLQLPQAPRDPARFAKIAAQPLWRDGAMSIADARTASERSGEPTADGGLMMTDARVIQPAAILKAWLEGVEILKAEVMRIERVDQDWIVRGPGGQVLARVDAVVVTAGWGAAGLLPDGAGLSPVRGQADWCEGPSIPGLAWGGYVAPTAAGFLYGATHVRGDVALEPRDAESAQNLDTLHARLPRLAEQAEAGERRRRVAIRATTPDRLPLAGRRADGIYLLSGLGSRGFCAAPLLGEHIAALVAGAPSPLPSALAARVDPGRLLRG
jgi:tRNA 5-methylaminomethyl-2-thiouridine biosynthesis bifunctional protein